MPPEIVPGSDPGNTQSQNQPPAAGTSGNPADTNGERAAAGNGVQNPATGQPFSYKEDRSNWIPPHRLSETARKAQDAEARAAALEADLEKERKRVRAAMGIDTPNPEDAEAEQVKAVILKMFPQLAKLDDATIEKVLQTANSAEGLNAAQQHVYQQHADQMLNTLQSEVSSAIGSDLSPSQQKSLTRLYRLEAEACLRERQENPNHDAANDFLARHLRGDKTLVSEFAKAFVADWFEPAKRAVTSQNFGRVARRVPNGRGGTPPAAGAQKVDFNNEDAFAEALARARADAQ